MKTNCSSYVNVKLKLTHNKHYHKHPQLSTRKPQIPKWKILQAQSGSRI